MAKNFNPAFVPQRIAGLRCPSLRHSTKHQDSFPYHSFLYAADDMHSPKHLRPIEVQCLDPTTNAAAMPQKSLTDRYMT
jgi:hypothetical protein